MTAPVEAPPSRVARIAASGTVRLLLGLVVVVVATVGIGRQLEIEARRVPTPVADRAVDGTFAARGNELIAVVQTDQPSPEFVALVERITGQARSMPGITEVRSPTTALVLVRGDDLTPGATPAYGTASQLPLSLTLPERARLAAASRLGTADLVSEDGQVMLVVAEVAPADHDTTAEVAERFRAMVDTEVAAAGVPATVHIAGTVATTLAAADSVRHDLITLVGLAVVAPALLAAVLLRRRAPAGSIFAAGGAALLVAAVVVVSTAGTQSTPLDVDHPVAVGTRIIDEKVNGTVPFEVEFTGAPGVFRRPEMIARVDALGNWLRDEYGVRSTGLSSTLRDETALITGVDSVPPNPADLESLLGATTTFADGSLLASLLSADGSRTRLVGTMTDRDPASVERMAERFDSLAQIELADTGIAARLSTQLPAVEEASTVLVDALALLGALTLAVGATTGAIGMWGVHELRVADRRAAQLRASRDRTAPLGDEPDRSLFARGLHGIHLDRADRRQDRQDRAGDGRFDRRPERPPAGPKPEPVGAPGRSVDAASGVVLVLPPAPSATPDDGFVYLGEDWDDELEDVDPFATAGHAR